MTFLKLPFAQTTEIIPLLIQHPVFQDTPEPFLLPLLVNGAFLHMRAGEYLCHERENARCWWLLLEGEMESLRYGIDGEERIFCYFSPCELVAEVLMFAPDSQFPISIRARSSCRLFQMQRQDLHDLCEQEPRVAIRLLERASQRLCRRIDEVEWMARATAAQRLANYLLKLRERQENGVIELPVNQRQLAATLGIKAETLNRLLADWLQQGYIRGRRRSWEVMELETLERIAQTRN
jgi:CRP-like cAMP-binding protein